MRSTLTTLSAAIAMSVGLSANVAAESANAVHLGKSVSKQQVIELLAPKSNEQLLTRGLHLRADQQKVNKSAAPRAISLEVFFAFDSAELSQTAKEQLTPVGEALKSEQLQSVSFVLEGHTDAAGSELYNRSLSEKRADSVKSFFLQNFALADDRVDTQGKGEAELLKPSEPLNGANRRVTIIAQ